ncbi:type VII secretion-associated protein [Mycolicibacterium sarraceniae]|uniref:Type VII secretion-associated protein n=1 Tax=Mycolicibacterium sarraceniae TaxID=1534348 RepID=A0A7I7SL81_9MYCO|nr:type VII secretion-associated protein [Mycolicibacterium sarraceniae]BBY57493.1 type VII secretion-associated protein [Mycolicibacterium sarraceniae]
MPAVISTVLEIGPAAVLPLPTSISTALVDAALAGIDDTTVLLQERPVAVSDLWQSVIAASVEPDCESLTVVHPSWWAPHRVQRVVAAGATVANEVHPLSRSAALGVRVPAVVVEIADEVVAISPPAGPPVVVARPDDPGEVAQDIEIEHGTGVLIDAPPRVAGAADYARALQGALRRRGAVVRLADIGDEWPAHPNVEPRPEVAPRRRRAPVLAATSMALAFCAIGVVASRTPTPAPALDAVDIVEGRVTLRIPAHWRLTRITAGPGSRRIQASSPTDSSVALHMTQSYSPGETLSRVAQVLRQAVDEQPDSVFVDFNPADRRGGRPAITYREVRIGRDIRWAVVLDGSTRISIGCQSAPGRDASVAPVCDRAIESARELVGTNTGS